MLTSMRSNQLQDQREKYCRQGQREKWCTINDLFIFFMINQSLLASLGGDLARDASDGTFSAFEGDIDCSLKYLIVATRRTAAIAAAPYMRYFSFSARMRPKTTKNLPEFVTITANLRWFTLNLYPLRRVVTPPTC